MKYRLAVGSFKEDTHNYVEIIQRKWAVEAPKLRISITAVTSTFAAV
jgi:hypothetical protein